MSGSHDFCVTRSTESNQEKFRASFKYGDIDPAMCPGEEVQELTVSATIEQLQALANAVGSGNVAGAAVLAADIAVGGAVAIVKGAGKAASDVVDAVKDFFKKPFG
jgi:hypothetical protein